MPIIRRKHEEPSKQGPQPESEPQPPTDLRKLAEKPAAAPERDISTSRSYYQFKDEPGSDGLADINIEAKAYESIKN